MALSSSGPIKFSQIKTEFGSSTGGTPVSLGNYRVSETYGAIQNMPLDAGIPQSGAISMSNFYGKRLNIVVNYYSGGDEFAPETGAQRYKKNQKTECVGEFRNPPKDSDNNPETAGRTVWLHVNKLIGQTGQGTMGQARCSFRTGNWKSGTDLRVVVGGGGVIRGRGGSGGNGGFGKKGDGKDGEDGSSAIGIQYTNAVATDPYGKCYVQGYEGSKAYGGGGGGGGGGAATQDLQKFYPPYVAAGGGGGGGGAGLPSGAGGAGGDNNLVPEQRYGSGDPGQGGGLGGGGLGSQGGRFFIPSPGPGLTAEGGNAGNGGGVGGNGQAGQGGKVGDDGKGTGGEAGAGGNWLRTQGLDAGFSASNHVQVQWQGSNAGGSSDGGVSDAK